MGFDPFLVELEAGGHREEVAVLQGTLVEADGRREEVGFDPFFLVFWLIVGVGWWVLILIGLAFLVHWWVLMILLPIGWVMIWLGGDGSCGSVRERGSEGVNNKKL